MQCPNCEKENVKTNWQETFLTIRVPGQETADYKVKLPIRICPDCQFEYSDYEAEEVADKFLADLLESFGVKPVLTSLKGSNMLNK